MEILFCDSCRRRIDPGEVDSGRAVVGEDLCYCPECAKKLGVTAGAPKTARRASRPAAGPRRTSRVTAPAPGARSGGKAVHVAVAAGAAALVVTAVIVMNSPSPEEPPARVRQRERPREAGAPDAKAAPPVTEKVPSDRPRSLFDSLRPGGDPGEPDIKSIFADRPGDRPADRPTAEETAYGPVPPPPGYAVPAQASYRQDFEKGLGPWKPVRRVRGGFEPSQWCAHHSGGDEAPEHWGYGYTMTEDLVWQAAVYVTGKGGRATVYFLSKEDVEGGKNWHAGFEDIERGKWHVLRARPSDWGLWGGEEQNAVGRKFRSLIVFVEDKIPFALDDFVLLREGAARASYAGAAPPGYSMPPRPIYSQRFESGRAGKWEDVTVVAGGLTPGKWCARTTADRSSECEGAGFTVTERTVVRVAVYVPAESRDDRFILMAWDPKLGKNFRADFRGLGKGRWHVVTVRAADWRIRDSNESALGRDISALKVWAGTGKWILFDDVVVYEEVGAAKSPPPTGAAPPGYSLPANAHFKADFEKSPRVHGDGFERVAGGFGGRGSCAVGRKKVAAIYIRPWKMTSRTVVRVAVCVPPEFEGDKVHFRVFCDSRATNCFQDRAVPKGKWQVLTFRIGDWADWNGKGIPEGALCHDFKVSGGVFVDDVVVYEE